MVYGIRYTVYCGLYRYILLQVYGADINLWALRIQDFVWFQFLLCPFPCLGFLPPARFWKTVGGIVLGSVAVSAVSADVLLYISVAIKASFLKLGMCNICKNNIAKMFLDFLSFTSTEVKILDFDQVLFIIIIIIFLSTFVFFSPYLKN